MKNLLSKEELINFEEDIAKCFLNKEIKAPIHLDDGCEDQLIEIFKEVDESDYVFCSWRSHYRALLKGVSRSVLKKDILEGRSISLCYRKQKVFSSAIVAGNISPALGVAMDIQRKGGSEKVWCFVGEMTSCHGSFFEALTYAENNKLPITFVVEDNSKSVKTVTREVIGNNKLPFEPEFYGDHSWKQEVDFENGKVIRTSKHLYWFKYKHEKYPHSGPSGQRIVF